MKLGGCDAYKFWSKDPAGKLSGLAIIIIAVLAGVATFLLLLLLWCCCVSNKREREGEGEGEGEGNITEIIKERKENQIDIFVYIKNR